jgi:serine/threonine protein kinase
MSRESQRQDFDRGIRRSEPVLDRIQFGPRTLEILEKLSSVREVYRVFDPSGAREFRRLTLLPFGRDTEQHLRSLKRVTENDPHHLPILELRRVGDRLLVLQPWIFGQSLEQYLGKARRGRAPVPGAVQSFRLARGLAHAMAKVHRVNDLVHGDLKPANLLLVRGKNRLIPIDYGSAWPGDVAARRVPGDGISPVYAAPEQLRGDTGVDWRVDQFAIGTILFELLTLKIPYEGLGGRVGVTPGGEAITLSSPSLLSSGPSQLPRSLWGPIDTLVTSMLARNAGERFASTADLLAEFDRVDLALRVAADGHGASRGIWDLIIDLIRGPAKASRGS